MGRKSHSLTTKKKGIFVAIDADDDEPRIKFNGFKHKFLLES